MKTHKKSTLMHKKFQQQFFHISYKGCTFLYKNGACIQNVFHWKMCSLVTEVQRARSYRKILSVRTSLESWEIVFSVLQNCFCFQSFSRMSAHSTLVTANDLRLFLQKIYECENQRQASFLPETRVQQRPFSPSHISQATFSSRPEMNIKLRNIIYWPLSGLYHPTSHWIIILLKFKLFLREKRASINLFLSPDSPATYGDL